MLNAEVKLNSALFTLSIQHCLRRPILPQSPPQGNREVSPHLTGTASSADPQLRTREGDARRDGFNTKKRRRPETHGGPVAPREARAASGERRHSKHLLNAEVLRVPPLSRCHSPAVRPATRRRLQWCHGRRSGPSAATLSGPYPTMTASPRGEVESNEQGNDRSRRRTNSIQPDVSDEPASTGGDFRPADPREADAR